MSEIPKTFLHYAVELHQVSKQFGSVWANKNIDLVIKKATIHGIVGENGAGKSTLMSVLYGFYQADSGSIFIDGESVKIAHSTQAIALGIGMVHQHFMLVETLTALENIVLGAESSWSLDQSKRDARIRLQKISDQFGLEVPLDEPVGTLSVGVQQRVEILKALYRQARVLILDEPTGVLTPQEADQLFDVLRALRAQGVTVLLITHKLREIMAVTDYVSVMRAGEMVAHRQTNQTNAGELAELMVGRPVTQDLKRGMTTCSDVYLSVKNLSFTDERGVQCLNNISFDLKSGEIVGLAGVSGNGQTELLKILSGELRGSAGSLRLLHEQMEFDYQTWPNPRILRTLGVAHIPEDRLGQGLLKDFNLQESAILGYQRDSEFGSRLSLTPRKVREYAQRLIDAFDVRPSLPDIRSANMSGGNQQKLIIAREMSHHPKVLLVGQPTRGVDIGAIELIYKELIQARDEGAAILVVSVELDEILTLSDRIIVMNQGQITGELTAEQADPKQIGLLMASSSPMSCEKKESHDE